MTAAHRALCSALLAVSVGCKKDTPPLPERAPRATAAPSGNSRLEAELQVLQGQVKATPESPEAWLALAEGWFRQGRWSGEDAAHLTAEAAALNAERLGVPSPKPKSAGRPYPRLLIPNR